MFLRQEKQILLLKEKNEGLFSSFFLQFWTTLPIARQKSSKFLVI